LVCYLLFFLTLFYFLFYTYFYFILYLFIIYLLFIYYILYYSREEEHYLRSLIYLKKLMIHKFTFCYQERNENGGNGGNSVSGANGRNSEMLSYLTLYYVIIFRNSCNCCEETCKNRMWEGVCIMRRWKIKEHRDNIRNSEFIIL
jgi:hypothetical protein